MHAPVPVRVAIIIGTVVSVFYFPWAITCVLLFFTGLALPAAALCIGAFAELVYYPGHGLPWSAITAATITLVAVAVRYLVKTRII